jgi:hypothetical protein
MARGLLRHDGLAGQCACDEDALPRRDFGIGPAGDPAAVVGEVGDLISKGVWSRRAKGGEWGTGKGDCTFDATRACEYPIPIP